MIYKHLIYTLIVRLFLITITITLLVLCFVYQQEWLTISNLSVLLILQLFLLVRKLNKVNKDLADFFNSVRNEDSSLYFPEEPGKSKMQPLYKELKKINETIKQIKRENYNQNIYYLKILNHIGTGVLVIEEEKNIVLVNKAANQLLKIEIRSLEQLKRISSAFYKAVVTISPQQEKLVKLFENSTPVSLLIKATQILVDGRAKKIITFQNIRNELDNNELESYLKLIRVLTHEIMNSTAPITSSIKVLTGLYKDEKTGKVKELEKMDTDIISHTVRGLEIIEERSVGLAEFVSKYRSLTAIKQLNTEKLSVESLINEVRFLFNEKMKDLKVECSIDIEERLMIEADKKLIIQVLINLMKNAIESLDHTKTPSIKILAKKDDDRVNISIKDNGSGMDNDLLPQIFVPFFTTKSEGSGVGLSLARQIMRRHNGDILVKSLKGEGTTFTLKF